MRYGVGVQVQVSESEGQHPFFVRLTSLGGDKGVETQCSGSEQSLLLKSDLRDGEGVEISIPKPTWILLDIASWANGLVESQKALDMALPIS